MPVNPVIIVQVTCAGAHKTRSLFLFRVTYLARENCGVPLYIVLHQYAVTMPLTHAVVQHK